MNVKQENIAMQTLPSFELSRQPFNRIWSLFYYYQTMTTIKLNQFNGLDTDAAVRMFRYHAGNTPVSYDDAKAVANLCGNNPTIIKVTL